MYHATSDQSEEVLRYIHKVNETLKTFIQTALEVHAHEVDDEFNLLPNEESLNGPRCWEELQCGAVACPAYKSRDYRCWLVAGTLCDGSPQGIFAQKYKSCFSCKVFRKFTETEVHELYENIGIIIRHLGDSTRKARELAVTDNLTGLYNRHYLAMIEEQVVKDADRRSAPLSMIVFDLNDFKRVNDRHGHLAGDEILKEFSAFLRHYTRESDLPFRLGGDEFLLLMEGANEEHCRQTEQRLLNAIGGWNASRKGEIPVPISFSLGGSTAVAPQGFDELMAEADRKMYAHKQTAGTDTRQKKAGSTMG